MNDFIFREAFEGFSDLVAILFKALMERPPSITHKEEFTYEEDGRLGRNSITC